MNLESINELKNNEIHKNFEWMFISLGFLNRRAHVFKVKNNNFVIKNIQDEILKLSRSGYETEWIREIGRAHV